MNTIDRLCKRAKDYVLASKHISHRRSAFSPENYNVKLYVHNRPILRANKGRYAFMLVKFIELGGCNVDFRVRPRDVGLFNSEKFMKWILESDHVSINEQNHKSHDIVISDKLDTKYKNRFLSLKYGYGIKPNEDYDVMLPFGLHPEFYRYSVWKKVLDMRSLERKVRFMFSGNVDSVNYGGSGMMDRFGKMNRYESIDLCINKSSVMEIKNADEFSALMKEGNRDSLCIVRAGQYRVPKDRWLNTLAHTSFFLALPGVKMPLSHNAVEAMAVGCIPVLSYPEMFEPELQDGVNCIAYDGGKDIVSTVKRVICMDKEKVDELRYNSYCYYDKHLTPASFMSKIITNDSNELRLGIPYFDGN